jgi:NADPH2 dehydrogenase
MLFEPLELKDKLLRNRVVSAPLASKSAGPEGGPTERSLEIYNRFSASGVGMVVAEHHSVNKCGSVRPEQFLADSDEAAKLNAKMASVIKQNGAVALVQINHGGAQIADPAVFDDNSYRVLSPSGVPVGNCWSSLKQKPYILTAAEIRQTIEDFVSAAVRMVKISGYDGVQIHASHGYLLGQFLSPLTNKRSDEWGGSDAGRARLLYEITDAVRQSLPLAIVSVRLGVVDYLPDEERRGLSLDETVPVAKELAALGVDSIHVTGNLCGFGASRTDEAYFAPCAARIKEVVGKKTVVECTGGIRTAATAEKMLDDGVCDLVGVGRLMLKDSDFLAKWKDELR